MPIYEYLCDDCGKKFEALRQMKDADSPISCRSCESTHTHRAISACFAHADGAPVAGSGGGCSGCSGGSCSSCHH